MLYAKLNDESYYSKNLGTGSETYSNGTGWIDTSGAKEVQFVFEWSATPGGGGISAVQAEIECRQGDPSGFGPTKIGPPDDSFGDTDGTADAFRICNLAPQANGVAGLIFREFPRFIRVSDASAAGSTGGTIAAAVYCK